MTPLLIMTLALEWVVACKLMWAPVAMWTLAFKVALPLTNALLLAWAATRDAEAHVVVHRYGTSVWMDVVMLLLRLLHAVVQH